MIPLHKQIQAYHRLQAQRHYDAQRRDRRIAALLIGAVIVACIFLHACTSVAAEAWMARRQDCMLRCDQYDRTEACYRSCRIRAGIRPQENS